MLLRPAFLGSGASSDFSGFVQVISAKSETVWKRRPALVGLYCLIPIKQPFFLGSLLACHSMHVPGVPLTYRERLPNEALIGVHALDSVPTRPGVSIHSRTQLQNYKESKVKWGYESEVHKIRTFADLRNHADPARGECARLAVFHFRIKSNLNTDGRVHSPLAGSKRFCRFGYN